MIQELKRNLYRDQRSCPRSGLGMPHPVVRAPPVVLSPPVVRSPLVVRACKGGESSGCKADDVAAVSMSTWESIRSQW